MRRRLAGALVVIASVLLIAATLLLYAHATLSDSAGFADRATQSIQDKSVRTLIGDRVTDQLILRHQADLLAARPIISSAVAGIVGSRPFGSLFRRSVLDAHRAVFARNQNTLTLTLADTGVVAGAALRKLKPGVAAELERSGSIALLRRHIGAGDDVVRRAARLRALAYLLAGLTLAAALAALAISVDRRQTAGRLGAGVAVAGVAIVVAYTIARGAILDRVVGTDERAAAGAVWDAYLEDLRSVGWVLAVSGAIIAAAAASVVRPAAPEGSLRVAWRWAATEPARPWPRALRAGALIVAGALVLLEPSSALRVAATLVGVYLLYSGVASLLRLINPPRAAAAPRPWPRPRARVLAVPVVAVAVVLAADAAFLAGGAVSAPAPRVGACDGSTTLCDRPLDDVVLPATHNSMAAPLKGWFSSQQERGIGGQLQDGIRGLLIDTYYADKLANGRVRTHYANSAQLGAGLQADGISEATYRAALRLRERLGFRGQGRRGIYLCHRFCEVGATPLSEGLREIHDFVVTHPSEVLVVVNQDSVTPTDFVRAVDDAGLAPYAFTPPSTGSWPTLRTMIEEDRRVVFLAENRAGAAPWYQRAYRRLMEETPFTFRNAAGLADHAASCAANRGPPQAPLFLVNNWVNTDPKPRPSIAAKVNAYATLLARSRACQRIRGHLPNLLAVDFYKRGELFRVVRTLNGT